MKWLGLLPFLSCSIAGALAEPSPKPATLGRILLDERFSGPSLPSIWQPGGRPGSFTIVDGALQGAAQPDDSHGPSIGVPVEGDNLTVAFRMRFVKPGYFLFMLDGKTAFGETDHLLRFVLTGSQAQFAQDSGTLASKRANAEARARAGPKGVTPTRDQLADPKFHRTEMIVRQPTKIAGTEWHDVRIEQRGNDVRAHIDDQLVLQGSGTVVDGRKSRIVFLIGKSGTVSIDDVRVWENEAK